MGFGGNGEGRFFVVVSAFPVQWGAGATNRVSQPHSANMPEAFPPQSLLLAGKSMKFCHLHPIYFEDFRTKTTIYLRFSMV